MTFLRRAILIILVLTPVLSFTQELQQNQISQTEDIEDSPGSENPATELNMDELRLRILGESPNEIMRYLIGDASVSLFMTGSWKGELQGNAGFSISPIGTQFAAPESPILFRQEVDLTMSLWINSRWFVEANFLDDSALNTYRAGYKGSLGEFVKYAGIGNAELDFPVFPYIDLGGDSPSSFGFYSRFGTQDFNIHALFRYDAASREERVFSGGRERTYSDVQAHDSVRGVSFVLPDTDIDANPAVYIEDDKGTISDQKGRRWRLAAQSEYAVSMSQGLLELSIRPQGIVAVVYSKNGERPWNYSLGSYDGSAQGYLTEVQNWFDPSLLRDKIKLEEYIQCGSDPSFPGRPGEVIFGTQSALVIFQNGAFSPFERRSRYNAPSSSTERAALVDSSTGKEIKGIDFIQLDSEPVTDAFTFSSIITYRDVYELVRSGSSGKRTPAALWPLAQTFDNYQGEPEIYLPGRNNTQGDVLIRFTNYNSISGFFIGTDAIPGSIQVYRSGIQDTNFNFNSSSGEVVIKGSVGQNEIIRITYLKKGEGIRLGSIAAGLGAIYRGRGGESPFSAQAAVGVRWNLTNDTFTEADLSNTGTVGISAKTALDYDNLNARITAGFAFVQTDTTGLYRAAGMEGNEIILYMPPELSFISNPPSSLFAPGLIASNRSDLIFRNYNNTNVLGNNLMNIDWTAPVITGVNRPYPAKDTNLGNAQTLVMEFNLHGGEWTGFQAPMDHNYGILSQAQEIEIPFRFYDFNKTPPSKFKLVIQIGSLSNRDFAFTENIDLIWEKVLYSDEWEINPPSDTDAFYTSAIFDYTARIARFILSDKDRQKLSDARHLRVIAVYEDNDPSGDPLNGRVLIASPIIRGASFRPITIASNGEINPANDFSINPSNKVTAVEIKEIGNALLLAYGDTIKKLHPESNTQRVLKIEWENMDSDISAGIDGRVSELPLSDYRELSFFIKGPPETTEGALNFIIAQGPQNISNRLFDVRIPLYAFTEGKWSKVSIKYQGDKKAVTVDGNEVNGSFFAYNPLTQIYDSYANRLSYMAMFISPDPAAALADGIMYIDEIILEDPVLFYRLNVGTGVEYSKPGVILKAGKVEVLSDFSINTALESEMRFENESENSNFSGSVVNRSGLGISLFGIKIKGNFAFTAAEDTFLWNADHSISKSIGPFSISEAFYASPKDNFAQHSVNLALNTDFSARFNADALYDYSKLRQKWIIGLGYKNKNVFIPTVTINSEAAWTSGAEIENGENYGKLWANSWEPLIPDSGSGAESRKTKTQFILAEKTKPVGAAITLEGNTNYTAVNSVTRSENNIFLDIPVTLEKTSLNFRSGRSFKKHLYYSSVDSLDDGRMFFESVGDSSPLWKKFPFYSLFTPELNAAMDESLSNSPSKDNAFYTFFSDYFNARATLPNLYNISSLFLPSRIIFIIDRVLEQKMDTRVDKLNIGTGLTFSAINIFGAMSSTPIFKFYQTDEFSHTFETAFVIPREEDMSWRINTVLSAGFRGFQGGILNFVNNFNYRSEGYWTENFTALWEAPVKKSYLSRFYEWVSKGIAKRNSWTGLSNVLSTDYEKLRKESVELIFDNSKDYLKWSLILGHEDIIRVIGRFNLSTFFKIRFSEEKEYEKFIFDAMLGITLRFSF
ncbi:MAG: hypothetical protein FWB95_01960 [Treponema sp.]|nr:hypothetical protein [Treponema sp.]